MNQDALSVVIAGRPAVLWGSGEKEWKETVRAADVSGLVYPRLQFRVRSLGRRGHPFDLDNLCSPVLGIVATNAESVWAEISVSDDEGVMITEAVPPEPPLDALKLRIENPPVGSIRRDDPHPSVAGVEPIFGDGGTRLSSPTVTGSVGFGFRVRGSREASDRLSMAGSWRDFESADGPSAQRTAGQEGV